MKHATLIQFDIETLSLHPTNAVVGEIGIHVQHLVFDGERVRTESDAIFGILLDMREQQRLGRELDIGTIQWWLKQNEMARTVMADPQGRNDVHSAIRNVDAFVRKHMDMAEADGGKVFILSSAPAFDMTNIRALYEAAGMEHPWQHWQEHSQRTLRKLCNPDTIPHRDSVANFTHGGTSDAEYQNIVLLAQLHSNDAGSVALQQFFFGD